MNGDSITKISPAIWFALIYVSNLWLSFALPLRRLWLVPVVWVGGLSYLWIAHHDALTSLLTILTLLPIIGLGYAGFAGTSAMFGLVCGQILRRVSLSFSIKCAAAIAATLVLIPVASVLGEYLAAKSQAETAAVDAQRPMVEAFYERTKAAGMEMVAKDPHIALITGERPAVSGGDPERRPNRADLPVVSYIFHAVGANGEAWAKVRINGTIDAPAVSVERIGRSWKEAAGS